MTSQEKRERRYRSTYSWAMGAEFQYLNQILKGVEKEIRFTDSEGRELTTGISSTDIQAIADCLHFRLSQEKNKA